MSLIEVTRRWFAGQSAPSTPNPEAPDALSLALKKRRLEAELRRAGWSKIQATAEASRQFPTSKE